MCFHLDRADEIEFTIEIAGNRALCQLAVHFTTSSKRSLFALFDGTFTRSAVRRLFKSKTAARPILFPIKNPPTSGE
jgi:hypothetical protein